MFEIFINKHSNLRRQTMFNRRVHPREVVLAAILPQFPSKYLETVYITIAARDFLSI